MLTFTYKHVHSITLTLDLHPPAVHEPSPHTPSPKLVPVVVNFHGGGLTVGDTNSWFPTWLKDRVTSSGLAFLSANYRLLPPSTGHDIVEDICDLFTFIAEKLNPELVSSLPGIQLDIDAIAVTGCSAGGLCAYLAVMHARPRPKAVVALYAMGGDFLTSQYVQPKLDVFLRGREMLDPQRYTEYLHPQCLQLEPTSRSPLSYHGPDAPIPGFPANPRMLLNRLYLQLGTYLDYYTGEHEPSLTRILRNSIEEKGGKYDVDSLKSLIPARHLALLPQFSVSRSAWPPVFFVHGSRDSAVWMKETVNMQQLLQMAGVTTVLRIVDGAEHSLDYVPNADELYGTPGGLFDEICDFLICHLRPVTW